MGKRKITFADYNVVHPKRMVKLLRDDGSQDLANQIEREAGSFKCSECGQTEKVGMSLNLEKRCLLYFCVPCSGSFVQEAWEFQDDPEGYLERETKHFTDHFKDLGVEVILTADIKVEKEAK